MNWRDVLKYAEYEDGIDSSYVINRESVSVQHASIVLRRLWNWSLLKRQKEKRTKGPGQPPYFYYITKKGEKYLSWYREQPEQKQRTREENQRENIDAIPKIIKTEKEIELEKIDTLLKNIEKEKALEEIKTILDEVEKRTKKSAPTRVDWVLDKLFWRELVYYLKDKGMLEEKML